MHVHSKLLIKIFSIYIDSEDMGLIQKVNMLAPAQTYVQNYLDIFLSHYTFWKKTDGLINFVDIGTK